MGDGRSDPTHQLMDLESRRQRRSLVLYSVETGEQNLSEALLNRSSFSEHSVPPELTEFDCTVCTCSGPSLIHDLLLLRAAPSVSDVSNLCIQSHGNLRPTGSAATSDLSLLPQTLWHATRKSQRTFHPIFQNSAHPLPGIIPLPHPASPPACIHTTY